MRGASLYEAGFYTKIMEPMYCEARLRGLLTQGAERVASQYRVIVNVAE